MATDNKYDRSIRIWGPHGQKALAEGRLCLVNASCTGAEALKNLVLPGCGHVTIVDGARVTPADVGSNFFVSADSVGQARAAVVLANLLEMNPDVKGAAVQESVEDVLARDPTFFAGFSVVFMTQVAYLSDGTAAAVAEACWAAGVPLLFARTLGLLGIVRTLTPEHAVHESKIPQQEKLTNLRVANPWPELVEFAMSIDVNVKDTMAHKHVPWVVLAIQHMATWHAAHGGAAPTGRPEQQEFLAQVKRATEEFVHATYGPKTPALFGSYAEANYRELYGGVNNPEVFRPPFHLRSDPHTTATKALFADPAAASLTADSKPFWFVVRAIADFTAETGELPLAGSLPDMTATPELYVALQRLYKAKADADVADVAARVHALLVDTGLDAESAGAAVDGSFIQRCCKNANFLNVVRTRPLEAEKEACALSEDAIDDDLARMKRRLRKGEHADYYKGLLPHAWYFAIRGADAFTAREGRLPGAGGAGADDAAALHEDIQAVLATQLADEDAAPVVQESHAAEVCRFAGGELHTVASIVGGVAAQEAVKLITHQFVPLNNTFVFNGINGGGTGYEM